ncbi:MAG: hypothetical protein GEV10_21045 [Streptosporangiales bacterium]|nr:hypothetical protein [Streptosporangiales bacterium]
MTGPTALLAAHARDMRDAELAPGVREKAVLCLLDALALGLSAGDDETVGAAASVLSTTAGGEGPLVWPTGRRATVGDAALLNGISAHAHFHDDTDMDAWAHPGSLIVPAVVAVAEDRRTSVDALVRGVAAGYSALNWLGAHGAVGRALVERGFRASPTLGSIGAAVGAATVLGLDDTEAGNAIGLATDVTGGLLEPVRSGAQDWRWQNGIAAWRGTMAALLAEAGVRGPAEPLAGPQGFLTAFCAIDVPPSWTEPPRAEAIHEVWFKRYPVLGDNMAPAIAAADLHAGVGDPAEITRIDVHINAHFAAYPGTSYRGPFDTIEQAMASTAFAVATLLAYASADLSRWTWLSANPGNATPPPRSTRSVSLPASSRHSAAVPAATMTPWATASASTVSPSRRIVWNVPFSKITSAGPAIGASFVVAAPARSAQVDAVLHRVAAEDHLAPGHGQVDRQLTELLRRDGERVVAEHRDVRDLAGLEGALGPLAEPGVRGVDGLRAQRLGEGERLPRRDDRTAERLVRHRRAEVAERVDGVVAGRVRAERQREAGVPQAAEAEALLGHPALDHLHDGVTHVEEGTAGSGSAAG